jgi:RNA-directed DNA polymerase
MVLSLDIKDFFPSIKSHRVYGFFKKIGYAKPVSVMLTELCTLNGSLPQGAPTSPCLSNLLSFHLDKRLAGFAIRNNIRYTRYADDLTFSGDFEPGSVIRLVRKILNDDGLALNDDKTRLMQRHNRQEVTGIVVNDKMQAPRLTRRKLRQAIYYIEKFGIDSHMEFTKNEKANYDKHLYGIANFILFVNKNDIFAKKVRKILHNI